MFREDLFRRFFRVPSHYLLLTTYCSRFLSALLLDIPKLQTLPHLPLPTPTPTPTQLGLLQLQLPRNSQLNFHTTQPLPSHPNFHSLPNSNRGTVHPDCLRHFPFDDHNPPCLDMIPLICADVAQFLGMHPDNVHSALSCAVHCRAQCRVGVSRRAQCRCCTGACFDAE